ncbi:hypothetical protein, partial [Roseospira marina]
MMAQARAGLEDQWVRALETARGRDHVNTIRDSVAAYQQALADMQAVGGDTSLVTQTLVAQMRALGAGLDLDTLRALVDEIATWSAGVDNANVAVTGLAGALADMEAAAAAEAQVAAAQDALTAWQEVETAQRDALAGAVDYWDTLSGVAGSVGSDVRRYLDDLTGGSNSTLGQQERMESARAHLARQVTLAGSDDADVARAALESLTDYAEAYREAAEAALRHFADHGQTEGRYFAGGGWVNGPGGPTDDAIAAHL